MEKSGGGENTGERTRLVSEVVSWIPKTPSTVDTNSTAGVDWLKKNKQKCESCSRGKRCCRRDFKYPCNPNCDCVLVTVWANLTLTDDLRRDKERKLKLEEEFPPKPQLSVDQKFVSAWGEKPIVIRNRQKWHSVKKSVINPPSRDAKGVNYQWQGWDHYDTFATTSSNYGTNTQNQERPKTHVVKRFSF